MTAVKNILGQRFHRLLVIKFLYVKNTNAHWLCLCDCGNQRIVAKHNLNKTKSCGCLLAEITTARWANGFVSNKVHGESGKNRSKEYVSYYCMKARCFNENTINYRYYGGRGIKVCKRWLGKNGFVNFLKDVGRAPSKTHTLDRINGNGNYTPSNCRWATKKQQALNTR